MNTLEITYEGAVPPTVDQIRVAVGYAAQVAQAKQVARLSQLTRSFELDDGTQIYVLDLQHVRCVHIIPSTNNKEEPVRAVDVVRELEILNDLYVIGFVSGAIGDTISLVSGGAQSPKSRELFSEDEALFKLSVTRHDKFAGYNFSPYDQYSELDSDPQFQYVLPGLYTGAMASVVQLLLGVGKRLNKNNDYPARWFKATGFAPQSVSEVHIANDASFLLENVDTIASVSEDQDFVDTQIAYDYRWNRTHGIVWGHRSVTDQIVRTLGRYPQLAFMYADRDRVLEPWLVEIGQRGIYAMPLPRDPLSFFDEARQQYKQVYPSIDRYLPFRGESESLFSALGGFPTGVCFPDNSEELDRWVRAGWVIKADLSLAGFYSGSPISVGHGWAFSSSTSQATNVTIKLETSGLRYGECWLLSFNITQNSSLHWNADGEAIIASLRLNDFIDTFKAFLLDSQQVDAVVALVNDGRVEDARQLFDSFFVTPWWTINVDKIVVSRGCINSLNYSNVPSTCDAYYRNFKYFEPILGKMLTYEFFSWVLADSIPPAQRPILDGPIFSTFVDDQLEVLYVCEERNPSTQLDRISDYHECALNWSASSRTIQVGLSPTFYTLLHDFRIQDLIVSEYEGQYRKSLLFFDCVGGASWVGYDLVLYRRVYAKRFAFERGVSARKYGVTSVIQAANNRSVFFMRFVDARYSRWIADVYSFEELGGGGGNTRIYGDFVRNPDAPSSAPFCERYTWQERTRIPTLNPCDYGSPSAFNCALYVNRQYVVFVLDGEVYEIGSVYSPTEIPDIPPQYVRRSYLGGTFIERIYGFGLPEFHGRVLKESIRETTEGYEYDPSPFSQYWDRIANSGTCDTPPWYVLRNYFGASFARLSADHDIGPILEFGAVPNLNLFEGSVLFGIVE